MCNVPAGCMPRGQTSQKDRVQSGLFLAHCSFIITLIVGKSRKGRNSAAATDRAAICKEPKREPYFLSDL
ncbi:uncharacterized [Tachysurus ichikawai]